MKVWYIVFSVFTSIIILIDLLIGFATTGRNHAAKRGTCLFCGCTRTSTTTFIIKSVLVVNYILFYFLLILTLAVFIVLSLCYLLTNLCNEGTKVYVRQCEWPFQTDTNAGVSSQYIDLRQFSPLLTLRSNETEFLYFKGDRLKKLCGDYVSALMFYIILCSIGLFLLSSGFVNFLMNLSVNWARTSTKQKYKEILYLNGAEMTAFNEPGSRF